MPYSLNQNTKYYNFQGKMPVLKLDPTPAAIPPPGKNNHPKLITDTTLRDGAQDPCFAILPNETKLRYFDLLHELDNGSGIIDCVEVFIYQKRDLWTLEKLLERGYDYPRVTTWTRALPKDIKELVSVSQGKVKETGMLASSSDHHIFDRLGYRSKQEAMEKYLAPILTACEHGIRPRVHLEDITRADIEGWVLPFVELVSEKTHGTAIFRICDTLGVGSPDPHTAPPFGIPQLIARIYSATGAELEFHGHNDFGNVTANSMAALRYGCKKVNVAFGGLGERTGNAPLEQIIANYIREYGDPGFKLGILAEMAEVMQTCVSPIPPKQPIVGRHIFTTQAGLHQTGVARQGEAPGGLIYLPFDPTLIGRENDVLNLIGALSGMDGIVAVINEYHKLAGDESRKLTTTSRSAKYVYDKIQDAYDGRFEPAEGRYVDFRETFFEAVELVELVEQYESGRSQNS
jgi:isopropylmalate/homocitrate/citramalate synthase